MDMWLFLTALVVVPETLSLRWKEGLTYRPLLWVLAKPWYEAGVRRILDRQLVAKLGDERRAGEAKPNVRPEAVSVGNGAGRHQDPDEIPFT